MEKLCRCCAKKDDLLYDICKENDSNPHNVNAFTMLKIFSKIEIENQDMLSKRICKECLLNLQSAFKFYTTFLQTQLTLKDLLHQIQKKKYPLILPKEGVPYKCRHCTKSFESGLDLKSHLKEQHLKIKKVFKCYECTKTFTASKLLLVHVKTHFDKNICKFCNFFFADDSSCKKHQEEDHLNFKYCCKKCSKEFLTRRSLILHMKQKHHSCLFYCHTCREPVEYNGRDELNDHIKMSHIPANLQNTDSVDIKKDEDEDDIEMDEEFLDEFFLNQDESFQLNEYWDDISLTFEEDFKERRADKADSDQPEESNSQTRYKCPKCKRGIEKQIDLKMHLANVHDMRVLVCNCCGYTFNRVEDLKLHRAHHFQDNTISTSVDKEYQSAIQQAPSVDDNVRNIETKNTIQCTFCLEAFSSRKAMYTHRKTNHLNQPLYCILCDKTFKTLLGLKYHLKVHTGSRDYHCPYCPQKFIADINLHAHIRTVHSEIKPHVCSLCDGRFATMDHLRKHVTSVHQKERNFLCSTCGKGFAQSSHLKQHLVVHTGERKYQCDICPKGFFKAVDLYRHILKMHPKAAST